MTQFPGLQEPTPVTPLDPISFIHPTLQLEAIKAGMHLGIQALPLSLPLAVSGAHATSLASKPLVLFSSAESVSLFRSSFCRGARLWQICKSKG